MKLLIGALLLAVTACEPTDAEPRTADLKLGKRAFQKCYSCHALEPGRNDLSGPTLYRIAGRRIAAEPGFEYSPAMKRFAEREQGWGTGLLDKFVADPEGLVPGTSMIFHGISDPKEREALIAYLQQGQTRPCAASLP